MTFESEGLYIVAFLHMVAAGELCCLSDNSGCILLNRRGFPVSSYSSIQLLLKHSDYVMDSNTRSCVSNLERPVTLVALSKLQLCYPLATRMLIINVHVSMVHNF